MCVGVTLIVGVLCTATAELTPLFPPIMSKLQLYAYDGSLSVQLKMWQKLSMNAFMNYLSSFELGFSLFKGFFPGGGVGPTSSKYRHK